MSATSIAAGRRRSPQLSRLGPSFATPGGALESLVLGIVPLAMLAAFVALVLAGPNPAFDFRYAYWTAGARVLHGADPYIWTPTQFKLGVAFVYPALSAVVFAPLSLIPQGVGSVLCTFVCIGLVPATLWTLRVRDWRLYTISLMWLPVFGAWQTGNETIFLVALTAAAWRYRDRPIVVAILVAVAISLKPLMWPLALWLLVTRRWRASGYALICGVALNLAAWAIVGFGDIGAYLRASAQDTSDALRSGYGLPAVTAHLGLGTSVGYGLMFAIAAALALALVRAGFRRRDERLAMTLTVALMLVASPLVWSHYFALLLVPLAIVRPRLGWLWALPLLMWVCPPSFAAASWQLAVAWCAVGTMLVTLARRDARRPAS